MRLNCSVTGKFVDFKELPKKDGSGKFCLLKVYDGEDTLTIFPNKDPSKWQMDYRKLSFGQDVIIHVRLQTNENGVLSIFEFNG